LLPLPHLGNCPILLLNDHLQSFRADHVAGERKFHSDALRDQARQP